MSSQVCRGAGIFMPYHMKDHLFAIMNSPDAQGYCLVLMISSIKEGRHYDDACLLDIGDHTFIRHPSYVVYRLADTPRVIHIDNMIARNLYRMSDDFSQEIYERIKDGIYNSDELPQRIDTYARDNKI